VGPLNENFNGSLIMAFDKPTIQNGSGLNAYFAGRGNVWQVLLGKDLVAQFFFLNMKHGKLDGSWSEMEGRGGRRLDQCAAILYMAHKNVARASWKIAPK
jgi:hypothetical protein